MQNNETQDSKSMVDQFFQKYEEIRKKMKRVNIMVIGKSGVGKSTLINSIFREEIATTGVGKPVTAHLHKYEKENVPLAIYDSQGLELDEATQQKVLDEIRQEIQNRLKEGKEENYIHVLWYCILANSNRIENAEIQWIKKWSELLPVIIVLTQCLNQDKDKDEFYKSIDKQKLPIHGIQKTLANPFPTQLGNIDSHGLIELIRLTKTVLPESVKRAFINAQRVDIESKVEEAQKYAKIYIAGAFGAGFTPLPFADAAILVPGQITLITHITFIFGVSVDKAVITALISSVGGVGLAASIGYFAANLLKLIPGVGTITGGLINGTVAATVTKGLADAYIYVMKEVAESELKGKKLTDEDITRRFKDQF